MRSWKILEWGAEPDGFIELTCPHCGTDASLATHGKPGALVIAAVHLALFFDPPGHKPPVDWMPAVIECRSCHHIFDGGADVR